MRARPWIRWLIPSRPMLRVTAYAVFVFSVLGLLSARVLLADVNEAALAAGHELLQLSDLVVGAEAIHLNGERMHRASTYTEQDVSTVLDRFEDYCAASPSMLGRAMTDFPKELTGQVERTVKERAFRLGFFREEAGERGMIACFVNDKPAGLADLKERLQHFFATRKLGDFGKFRYAFAEKTKAGNTHVVTVWADTELDLRAMFPAEGDAAGADSQVLPRPPEARRTLTAAAEGMPYALRIYTSTQHAPALRRFYDDWMGKNRFSPVPDGEYEGTITYLRDDGYQAFVTIGEEDGHSSVTLVEAGRTDRPPTAAVEVTEE